MTEENPYRAPEIAGAAAVPDEDDGKYRRIGGWLILFAISLVLTTLGSAAQLWLIYSEVVTSGQWESLTSPDSPAYHPLWGPTILLEALGNLTFVGIGAAAILLLFRRSRLFPRVVLVFLLGRLAFILVDLALVTRIPAVLSDWGPGDTRGIMQGLIHSIIWSLYIMRSVRVKKTFVE